MSRYGQCKHCNKQIIWGRLDGKSVPFDPVANKPHFNTCMVKRDSSDINPRYVYPDDIYKTLVRENVPGARWQYLGSVVRKMRQRRNDKQMMSKNNFKKRWGNG